MLNAESIWNLDTDLENDLDIKFKREFLKTTQPTIQHYKTWRRKPLNVRTFLQ